MILGLIQVKKCWLNDWVKAILIPEKLEDLHGKSSADPEALDQVRNVLRLHDYSIHTERSYIDWRLSFSEPAIIARAALFVPPGSRAFHLLHGHRPPCGRQALRPGCRGA